MLISEVIAAAPQFRRALAAKKKAIEGVTWYPYDTLGNLAPIADIASSLKTDIGSVLDVGVGDGDLAFLFSELGLEVTAIDQPRTNYNGTRGLDVLNEAFGNKVNIIRTDIDFGFSLSRTYDLCLTLGLPYHLRNPALLYNVLARHCE